MKKLILLSSALFITAISVNAQDKTTNGTTTNPAERQRNPAAAQKEMISNGNTSPEKTKNPATAENILPPKKEENNTGERKKAGNP